MVPAKFHRHFYIFLSLLTHERTPAAKLALIGARLPQHALGGHILRQHMIGGHGKGGDDGHGGQSRSTGAHILDHCCAIVAADNLFFTISIDSKYRQSIDVLDVR